MIDLAFGLREEVPADAKVAWGARLIIDMDGLVDLVYDRQDVWAVDEDERNAFLRTFQAVCPWPTLREIIKVRILSRSIDTRSNAVVNLFEDLGIKVVGNAKSSAGYLYVAAWPYGMDA